MTDPILVDKAKVNHLLEYLRGSCDGPAEAIAIIAVAVYTIFIQNESERGVEPDLNNLTREVSSILAQIHMEASFGTHH